MCDWSAEPNSDVVKMVLEHAHRRAGGSKVSFAHTRPFEDIPGSDGLRGAASRGFVTIVGPCGEHHTLSKGAAAALYLWIGGKLSDDLAMNAHAPVQRLVPERPQSSIPSYMEMEETKRYFARAGEWVSDALAKERASTRKPGAIERIS